MPDTTISYTIHNRSLCKPHTDGLHSPTNQLVNVIHESLIHKHIHIQDTIIPYYKYQSVLENKIFYDCTILTTKAMHFNRPDKILQDKINKYPIDVAVTLLK